MAHRKLKVATLLAAGIAGGGGLLAWEASLAPPPPPTALAPIETPPYEVAPAPPRGPVAGLAGPALAATVEGPPCVDRGLLPSENDLGGGLLPECRFSLDLGSFASAALAGDLGTGQPHGRWGARLADHAAQAGGNDGGRPTPAVRLAQAGGGASGGGGGGDEVVFRLFDLPGTTPPVLSGPGGPLPTGEVAVTPLPAGAWLTLAGLGALAGARRARRRG